MKSTVIQSLISFVSSLVVGLLLLVVGQALANPKKPVAQLRYYEEMIISSDFGPVPDVESEQSSNRSDDYRYLNIFYVQNVSPHMASSFTIYLKDFVPGSVSLITSDTEEVILDKEITAKSVDANGTLAVTYKKFPPGASHKLTIIENNLSGRVSRIQTDSESVNLQSLQEQAMIARFTGPKNPISTASIAFVVLASAFVAALVNLALNRRPAKKVQSNA